MDIISSSMNHQVDDQMVMLSQYYPVIYTQLVPERGEVKPRWRRKKNKGEGSSNTSGIVRKRKLSEEQVNLLERSFGNEQKLETGRKDKLASELGLDPQQVAVWFQNRRARWRNKKLKDEYSKLKAEHETMIVQKYCLETEVLKMKEQLSEAEKKIQRLLLERNCNNCPISTSSYSMEQPHFPGEFGIEEILMDNNVFFVPADQNSYINSLG